MLDPQRLDPDDQDRPSPMAEGLEWVARIMAVSLEMVLPGLGGHWLDQRIGTRFMVIAGFAFGITAGLLHLLLMTAGLKRRNGRRPRSDRGKV